MFSYMKSTRTPLDAQDVIIHRSRGLYCSFGVTVWYEFSKKIPNVEGEVSFHLFLSDGSARHSLFYLVPPEIIGTACSALSSKHRTYTPA